MVNVYQSRNIIRILTTGVDLGMSVIVLFVTFGWAGDGDVRPRT